MTSFS
jgi:predicted Zn-dependent protease